MFAAWRSVFGQEEVRAFSWEGNSHEPDNLRTLVRKAFNLPGKIGRFTDGNSSPYVPMSIEHLSRLRAVNKILKPIEVKQGLLPFRLRRRIISDLEVDGKALQPEHLVDLVPNPTEPSGLESISAIEPITLTPSDEFDAKRFIDGFLPQIERAAKQTKEREKARAQERKRLNRKEKEEKGLALSKGGEKYLDDKAKEVLKSLVGNPFMPRNNGIVAFDEGALLPDIPIDAKAKQTKTLVVGCMKDEGPYIIEWVAYHMGIGVNDFIIYSNDCADGTSEILDRLDAMGIIRHVNNDKWKGNSPQQAALNHAIKQPIYDKSRWIMHIDVDEFVNIRIGEKGTLDEVYDLMGDATNMAMTWRLFGHNNIAQFQDDPIIGQFTRCAPAFCPKPHTAWGFKTLFRNKGAYEKLSCHRPNKLIPSREKRVRWVNGSFKEMGPEIKSKGWRSSTRTIGYDAVQLNHYALRSAEGFLIKRNRGRALHVDRSVGMNYWTRMDWNSCDDISILRHLPRLKHIISELHQDVELNKLHNETIIWHKTKITELKSQKEFIEFYDQAINMKLTDIERVASALAAGMES